MPHKTTQKRKVGSQASKKEADVEAEKEASSEKSDLPEESEKSAASSKVTTLDASANEEKSAKPEESRTSGKRGKNSSSDTASAEKDKAGIGHRSSRRTKHKEKEGEADISSSDIVELDDNEEHEACASSDRSGARKTSKSRSKEISNTDGKIKSGRPGRPPKRLATKKEEPEAIELSDDGDSGKKGKRNLSGRGSSKAGSSTATGEEVDEKSTRKGRRGVPTEAQSVRKSNRSKQATNYIEIDVSDEEKETDEVQPELEKTKPLKKRKKELKSKRADQPKKNDPLHDESSDDLEVLSENIGKSSDLVVLSESISSKKGRRRSSRSPKVLRLDVSNRPSRNTPVKKYTEIDEDSDE